MPRGLFTEELFILEKEPLGAEIDITAEFSRYIFESPDSNFFVGLFVTDNYEEFIVTGNVPFELASTRSYVLTGKITEKEDKYTGVMERQLQLRRVVTLKPKGEVQTIKFLSNITGHIIASHIYDKYGEDTLEIIQKDPEKVADDFRGVTLDAAKQLQADVFEALSETSEAFPFLQNYGLSTDEVEQLVNRYGEEIKKMVVKNPFILMRNDEGFPGISFVRCDKIARDVKFKMDDPIRVKAGIEYTLIRQGNQGHVYFYLEDIIPESLKTLNNNTRGVRVREELVDDLISELILEGRLIHETKNNSIYLRHLYNYEKHLAMNLVSLRDENEWAELSLRQKVLREYLDEQGIELEDKQRKAVLSFSKSIAGLGVMNGGAGTGKTFTLNVFLEVMKRIYQIKTGKEPFIQLMAPTGRAAKVMRQATGLPASTIHRALSWSEEGFIHNASNPLSGDIIVVDEASMLDTSLAYHLTNAIRPKTKLILLGDPHQLPSIGAGNVLHDIISSGAFDVITLDVTKRQSEDNQVGKNGRLIAEMKLPEKDPDIENPKAITKIQETNESLVNQAMKAMKYLQSKGIPIDEIQLVTPGKKGMTGVNNLNFQLQQVLNPPTANREVLNRTFVVNNISYKLNFRVGDRVIHTVNTDELQWVKQTGTTYKNLNYSGPDAIITNGEIGKIHDIYEEEYVTQSGRRQKRDILIVKYEEGLVRYTSDDKKDLDHAYAITVHKSQGSQWQAVILMLSTEHFMLLDNSLLYTGYTRAGEIQILLSELRALQIALNTRKTFNRRTTLDKWILEETKYM